MHKETIHATPEEIYIEVMYCDEPILPSVQVSAFARASYCLQGTEDYPEEPRIPEERHDLRMQ